MDVSLISDSMRKRSIFAQFAVNAYDERKFKSERI